MSSSSPTTLSLQSKKGEIVVLMREISLYFHSPGFIRALTNVSFEVRRGEVFGLLGSTGSGKSAAMRILAGRLAPSEGKAKVLARSPRRRASRTRISYLPQKPSDARSQFLDQAIEFCRDLVVGAKRNNPGQSVPYQPDGEKRLGAMKRILFQKTKVVLLDEPFLALDAPGRIEMMECIRTIAQQGRTVIVCSDSLIHTKDICNRLAILYRGEVQAIGTIEELLAKPENLRFITDLLPDEMAGRLLEMVRLGIGVSDPIIGPPPQTQGRAPAQSPAAEAMPLGRMPGPTPETILAPLLRATPTGSDQVSEPTSTVNHEMLAALARPSGEPPAHQTEQPNSPKATDP